MRHSGHRLIVLHFLLHGCWGTQATARTHANLPWSIDPANWWAGQQWPEIVSIRKARMAHEEILEIWFRWVSRIRVTPNYHPYHLLSILIMSLYYRLCYRHGSDDATCDLLQVQRHDWRTNRPRWQSRQHWPVHIAVAEKSRLQKANVGCFARLCAIGLFLSEGAICTGSTYRPPPLWDIKDCILYGAHRPISRS